MTREEAVRCYRIPPDILDAYERWGLCGGAETGQYDDADLERLGTIMTLHDVGFTAEEAETYMRLLTQPDGGGQRLRLVEAKRNETLEAIHLRERQLQRLDYLRHEIEKGEGV